jgi:tetratricopeptide (TPR) repeat protein
VTIYDRNALTWGSDDKKVCAFMSEKDPSVMSFSKNVGAIVKTKGNTALNVNLLSAMAMHQALLLYGLAYVPDPKTPYASKTNESVDLLQYPRQTFEYRSGDCDDLTILFCSLLEAIGIETAAITVPGHIFMAFAVGVSPDEVRKTYLHPDDFIFSDGKSWIPVEITERTGGFLLAWQEGAQEWRENVARQQANFILVHDGWNTYQPVGLPGLGQGITVPAAADIAKSFQAEMERFVDNEISLRAAKIQADIKKAETAKLDNSLGVLYGRYGLMDRAENAFQRALGKEEYVPTLLNLANIAFSKKEMDKALGFCDRASKNAPDSPQVLLAVARVNHAMENYGSVSKAYARLKALDPVLAEQFAYLDLRGSDAQKAADVSNAGVLVWAE